MSCIQFIGCPSLPVLSAACLVLSVFSFYLQNVRQAASDICPRRSCTLAGMRWTERLAETIVLDNGDVLYTLHDAREFLLSLPEQDLRYAKWQRVVGSLLGAAHTGRADIITIATEQLKQALLTPPLAPARLADDPPPKKPPAPSVKHHLKRRRAKLLK